MYFANFLSCAKIIFLMSLVAISNMDQLHKWSSGDHYLKLSKILMTIGDTI